MALTGERRGVGESVVIAAMAASAFFVLLLPGLTGAYGLFIDELYYLACSSRLDFGYVDHPPMAPLLLRASRLVTGDSVGLALRIWVVRRVRPEVDMDAVWRERKHFE